MGAHPTRARPRLGCARRGRRTRNARGRDGGLARVGEAISRAFAARGCTLGLIARSADRLERLAASLPGADHAALEADVSDAGSIAAAIRRFAPVDVLVANAGITHYMPFSQLPLEQAEQMDRVNWLGTLYTIKAALPGMLERRRGHFVVISSGGGVRGFPHAAVYNGTKAAQRAFAEALRQELHDSGVSVTTVYPGEVATSLDDHELERMPSWYRLDRRAPAEPLGERVVEAVEQDRREVFYPPIVRLLRVLNGVSPRAADVMLRRIMGESAAPRRD